jgi:hypothetical protein
MLYISCESKQPSVQMMNTRSSSMTKVTILPMPDEHVDVAYHALAGDKQSVGKTAGVSAGFLNGTAA